MSTATKSALIGCFCLLCVIIAVVDGSCSSTYTKRVTKSVRYTTKCGFLNWGRCARYKTGYYIQTLPCNKVWGSWVDDKCSKTCGYGIQRRTRKCISSCCSGCTETSTVSCIIKDCIIHGGWSSYSAWTTCPVTCGGGTQTRTRTCTNPAPQHGGNTCYGSSSQSRACETNNCPIHGGWSSYSAWTTCPVTCGGGTQTRTRTCTNPAPQYGGNTCYGSSSQSKACGTNNCPIHGGWSSYSAWTTCPVTCGGGTQTRTRTCTNPAPQYGGNTCYGSSSQSIACGTKNCPINGGWSDWIIGTFQECPETCGNEILKRKDIRTCTNPVPRYGGEDCGKDNTRIVKRSCLDLKCPVNGEWSQWSDWSAWTSCSKTCDKGWQKRDRSRSCTDPVPINNGKDCVGNNNDEERQTCMNFKCKETVCAENPATHQAHPDPKKCNMFLNCPEHKVEIVESVCPKSLAWNDLIKTCDRTAAASCSSVEKACKENSFEKHETDCKSYYWCVHGKQVLQTCAADLLFNAFTSGCDHASNVKCSGEGSGSGAGQAPCTGYEKHESDCGSYYQCVNGERVKRPCPPGLHWNASGKYCDWPQNAKCE